MGHRPILNPALRAMRKPINCFFSGFPFLEPKVKFHHLTFDHQKYVSYTLPAIVSFALLVEHPLSIVSFIEIYIIQRYQIEYYLIDCIIY